MPTIISVENLSKQYHIGTSRRHNSFRDIFDEKVRSFFKAKDQKGAKAQNTIWALQDVSFDVQEGEVLGIVGRNGAGKSTLLKILSRITGPTLGRIRIRGRIASLLEVGTGFSGELTGRENIFLNGAILGMKRNEILRKLDEIIAFAEIEKFIDTPAKRYSSGMYMRLAFAVAAHLEPEILVVDEVLAVGDAQFQKKCLGKMEDVRKKGRTVLFVSHNMDAVVRLCRTSILLNSGRLIKMGETGEVINTYLKEGIGLAAEKKWQENEAPSNDNVALLSVAVRDTNNQIKANYDISEPVEICIRYGVKKDGRILQPAINLFDAKGVNILDSHDTNLEDRRKEKHSGIYESYVHIPGNFFSEGVIVVGVAILTPDPFFVHIHEKEVIAFNMHDTYHENSARGDYVGAFPGIIRPLFSWKTRSVVQGVVDK